MTQLDFFDYPTIVIPAQAGNHSKFICGAELSLGQRLVASSSKNFAQNRRYMDPRLRGDGNTVFDGAAK